MTQRILRGFNFGVSRMQLPSDGVQLGQNARHLRMDTLVKLRWFGVVGQAVTIFVTAFVLHFSLNLILCLGLVSVLAGVIFWRPFTRRGHLRLSEVAPPFS